MDKNIRIAIIGGGPAGLSAGMYLEKKGYENYVIRRRQVLVPALQRQTL